jgi:predicted DNA-binding protein with PD1-like motif
MGKNSSGAKAYAFRLKPKDDLKKSILAFAEENKIRAGSIGTCVGSLEQFHIRFANQRDSELKKGFFEIVSLTGTFSNTSCHLHISIADLTGITIGGHLLDNNVVYTTAEIIILELVDLEFKRELDSTYGYQELVVEKRKQD